MLGVCGIGAANTALHLSRMLMLTQYTPVPMIQLGIAGSYDPDLPLAQEVYEVIEDTYADLGAHTPDGFRDLQQLGFVNIEYANTRVTEKHSQPHLQHSIESTTPLESDGTRIPFYNGFTNPHRSPLSVPKVKAATVQAVSGDEASIRRVRTYVPDAALESMEGAAFFQVGHCFAPAPFYQFRSISNRVEPRNPARWKIKPAIDRAGEFVVELIRQQPDWLQGNQTGNVHVL